MTVGELFNNGMKLINVKSIKAEVKHMFLIAKQKDHPYVKDYFLALTALKLASQMENKKAADLLFAINCKLKAMQKEEWAQDLYDRISSLEYKSTFELAVNKLMSHQSDANS